MADSALLTPPTDADANDSSLPKGFLPAASERSTPRMPAGFLPAAPRMPDGFLPAVSDAPAAPKLSTTATPTSSTPAVSASPASPAQPDLPADVDQRLHTETRNVLGNLNAQANNPALPAVSPETEADRLPQGFKLNPSTEGFAVAPEHSPALPIGAGANNSTLSPVLPVSPTNEAPTYKAHNMPQGFLPAAADTVYGVTRQGLAGAGRVGMGVLKFGYNLYDKAAEMAGIQGDSGAPVTNPLYNVTPSTVENKVAEAIPPSARMQENPDSLAALPEHLAGAAPHMAAGPLAPFTIGADTFDTSYDQMRAAAENATDPQTGEKLYTPQQAHSAALLGSTVNAVVQGVMTKLMPHLTGGGGTLPMRMIDSALIGSGQAATTPLIQSAIEQKKPGPDLFKDVGSGFVSGLPFGFLPGHDAGGDVDEAAGQPRKAVESKAVEPSARSQQADVQSSQQAQPVNVNRIPNDRNSVDISINGEARRATVTTAENDDGTFTVKRIKLHDPATGAYDDVPVPPEFSKNFASSADAREAIFQRLESKYAAPRQFAPPASPTAQPDALAQKQSALLSDLGQASDRNAMTDEQRLLERRQLNRNVTAQDRSTVLQAQPQDLADFQQHQDDVQTAQENAEVESRRQARQQETARLESLPTYTSEQLGQMPPAALKRVADQLGVTFDTKSTTVPRILDAQDERSIEVSRRRLDELSNKELWNRTRDLGLRAGTRAENIETLALHENGQTPQQSTAPKYPPGFLPAADAEPSTSTPANLSEAKSQPTVDMSKPQNVADVASGEEEISPPTRSKAQQAEHRAGFDNLRPKLQNRIERGNSVPTSALEPFRGEPWADNYLAKRTPRSAPAPDSLTSRRAELQQQVRDAAAEDLGFDQVYADKPQPMQSAARRGDVRPGYGLPLKDAIEHIDTLPDDHPAKIVLHNLREMEQNPRGTKFQKINTNDVPDGTQIVVNDKAHPMVIDKEMGEVRDDIRATIPDGGVDLYGKKVIPPVDVESKDFQPPSAIKPGLFGQSTIDSSGVGEQKPLFHQPNEVAPQTGDKVAASKEAVNPANTGELFKPASEAPAPVGKLEALEAWGRQKLKDLGGTGLRGGIPLDPVRDPQRLAAYVAIGVAKLGRGLQSFGEWSKSMLADFTDLTQQHLTQIWRNARRVNLMPLDEQSEWYEHQARRAVRQATIPQSETTKQTIRRETGLSGPAETVPEIDALHGNLRAQARAARAGWNAAVAEGSDLRSELTDLVQKSVPMADRGKMLGAVAQAQTLADMNRAVMRLRSVVADRQLKDAVSDVEDLVGTLKTKVYRAPTQPGKPVRVLGDVSPESVREVDLTKLPPPAHTEIRPLIEEAKYIRAQMKGTEATPADKLRMSQRFREIEQQIRVVAANSAADREITVAGKVQKLNDVVKQTVQRIGAAPQAETASGEAPKEPSTFKALWSTQLTPDATMSQIVGEDHPAYDVAIRAIRRADDLGVKAERQKYETGLQQQLVDAGLPPHSAAYDKWLTTREPLTLPDAGKVAMTRPEMLDVYGHSQDKQTARDIANGATWNFDSNRLGRPIKLTPADVETIIDQLKPGEKNIVDWHKKYVNDNLTDAATNAKLAIDQRAPDPIEGYWPRARNMKAGEVLPSDWKQAQKRWLENISSQQERGNDPRTPLLIRNAVGVMHDFVDDNAKLIHMAEPLRSAAAVMESPEVARAIEAQHGPAANQRIKQYLLDVAGAADRAPRTRVEKIVSTLMRNISRSWLSMNPATMMKAVGPGTMSLMAEFPDADLSHGIREAAKPGAYDRMVKTSPFAWDRYEGRGLYGQYSPLLEKRVEPEAQLGFTDALKRGRFGQAVDAIKFLQRADAVPLTVAYHAAESFVDRTQPGLDPAARREAVELKFGESIRRTQNGNSPSEISYLASRARQSGPLMQMFLMFQSRQNKVLNEFARWSQLSGTQKRRLLVATLSTAAADAGIGYGLHKATSAISGNNSASDDQRNRENLAWNFAEKLLGTSYAGNLVTDVARGISQRGEPDFTNPVTAETSQAAQGLLSLVNAARNYDPQKMTDKQADRAKDVIVRAMMRTADSGRSLIGDPTVPLTQMIERTFARPLRQPARKTTPRLACVLR